MQMINDVSQELCEVSFDWNGGYIKNGEYEFWSIQWDHKEGCVRRLVWNILKIRLGLVTHYNQTIEATDNLRAEFRKFKLVLVREMDCSGEG